MGYVTLVCFTNNLKAKVLGTVIETLWLYLLQREQFSAFGFIPYPLKFCNTLHIRLDYCMDVVLGQQFLQKHPFVHLRWSTK